MTAHDNFPTPLPPQEGAPQANLSLWQRMGGVLFSPAAVFEDIARKPTWAGMMALVVALNLVTSVIFLMTVDMEKFLMHQMEENSAVSLSGEQMEQALELQKKIVPVTVVFVSLVGAPVVFFLLAGIFYVLLKIFGGEHNYMQTLSVTVFSFVILSIKGLLSLPVLLMAEEPHLLDPNNLLRSNLTLLMNEETSKPLYAFGASVDLFTLWTLVVMAIGFGAVSKRPVASAAVVAILWLLWVIVKVGAVAIGAALSGGL
jgi:hypothetical protein